MSHLDPNDRRMYSRIVVSGPELRASRTQRGAFVQAAALEWENAMRAARAIFNVELYNNGYIETRQATAEKERKRVSFILLEVDDHEDHSA